MANAELLSNLYNAFASGDIPTVLGSMDPEIRWHQAEGHPYMASGEAWVGPDAVLNNLFVKLGEDWDEFAVAPSTFHDAGDVVAVEGRYTGTHSTTEVHGRAVLPHLDAAPRQDHQVPAVHRHRPVAGRLRRKLTSAS